MIALAVNSESPGSNEKSRQCFITPNVEKSPPRIAGLRWGARYPSHGLMTETPAAS
jgi:hypothetical protein